MAHTKVLVPLSIALALVVACSPQSDPSPAKNQVGSLRYSLTRFMHGVDHEVEYVKTPTSTKVRGPFGEMSIGHFHELNVAKWVESHGRVSAQLSSVIDAAADKETIPVAVLFRDPLPPSVYEQLASTADAHSRKALLAKISDSLERPASELAAQLESRGFVTGSTSRYLPLIFGKAAASNLRVISRMAGVELIFANEKGTPAYDVAPNFVTDPKTDYLNGIGLAGREINVGIADVGAGCEVYAQHESVSLNNSVTHSKNDPIDSCESPGECPGACGNCVNNRCVHDHTSWVSSVLVGNKDGSTWGAGESPLFVYNGSPDPNYQGDDNPFCNPEGADHGYSWLLEQDVQVVAQTFTCYISASSGVQAGDEDGLVQDLYVSKYRMSVFKSAGNRGLTLDGEACSLTLNSVCVGAATDFSLPGYAVSGTSNWRNPFYSLNPEVFTDREEPDLVAKGTSVDVMDFSSATAYTTQSGTSFATPAVAGIAAIMKGSNPDLRWSAQRTRVCLAMAGYNRNADQQWRYSTPGKGYDFKDGAGGIEAEEWLYEFCGYEGEPTEMGGTGVIVIDTTRGSDPPEGEEPPSDDPPPGESTPESTLPASSSNRAVEAIFEDFELRAEERLRAVIAWRACVGTNYLIGVAPTAALIDFDLMLYREPDGQNAGEWIYLSQSIDDNIEGFDLEIPSDGNYSLYVSWEDGDAGCLGSTGENLAWGWTRQ